MLVDALGVHLLVLVGSVVPLPAPRALTDLITKVEVTNDSEGRDGFQVTLTITRDSAPDFAAPLLLVTLTPGTRFVLALTVGASLEVLIDGLIQTHEFAPSQQPGTATLVITGRDVSNAMELQERNENYPNQEDSIIATQVIARYARYGMVPTPIPTTTIRLELLTTTSQQENDYAFLQRLAQRNGYVFYVEPITIGVNKAYFGPQIRAGIPQRALTHDMGAWTTLNSISFTLDANAPVGTSGSFIEPFTKMSIPIPALPPLKIPPLALLATPASRTRVSRDTARANPAEAATSLLAAATNAPDAVTATGELDVARYGSVLRARKLVGVRGVGLMYDGLWYVKKVTTTVARGSCKQSFTIGREGIMPTVPAVIP